MSTSKSSPRPAPARTALEAIAADITQRVRETREKISELEKSRSALAALIDSRIKNGALYGASYPPEARDVDRAELGRRDSELEDLVQMAGVLQLELRRLDRELSLVGMTEHVSELERINAKVGPLGVDVVGTWNHLLDLIVNLVDLNGNHQQTCARHKQDSEDFEREYGEPCTMLPGGTIPADATLAFDIFEFWDRARDTFKSMPGPDLTRRFNLSVNDYPLLKEHADASDEQDEMAEAAPTAEAPEAVEAPAPAPAE
jgi:hypothetical protein